MSDRSEDDWFERALAERRRQADDGEGPDVDGVDETDEVDAPAGIDRSTEGERTDAETEAEGDETPAGDDAGPESLFEEDFATALENVELPTLEPTDVVADAETLDFGFNGPGEAEFDDETFESALARIDLGIDGLDRMIQGGVPERSLMVAIGGAGTGKTTFGLQFLAHGLERDERAVFITLEETRQRVIDSATEKGFPFDAYVESGQLAVVDVDPVEMAKGLASIRSDLPRLIEEFEATRLVLDSVSLLEMMYDDRARRRNEIFDFTQSLKAAGVTALLTSEASSETPYASRYGVVEYLTDAVFVLRYVRSENLPETRLAIEIQKIRDANHSRDTKPYEITGEGLEVYQQANLF
ncbi:KaiC domain-containing protein [Natronobiforma cellulositropha]|uniref:KaiC domain-containing protein n=1 Tax=Natronobiforma cellulositropha TaxID=1679076 RepID=UPI0021D6093E|nr:KaiC domain-containing protein [Natronobiforma cellulositropha]